jgi:hydroxyacylglutathione hydrolase
MLIRIWQKTVEQEKIRVFVFQELENNYSYIVETRSCAIVIDPSESDEILATIKEANLDLKAILLTHYHQDHIQGVKGILKELSPQVVGPNGEEITFVDMVVSNQEELIIGPFSITAIGTPGHTLNHLCYYLADFQVLFSGDMIFPCGCGKILEGSYQLMLDSLKVLKALPKETYLFSGHEYSLENLQFALSIEPSRQDIKERIDLIASKDQYPVPTTIGLELQINPFFRTDDIEFRKTLNLGAASELEMLIKLREIKENQQS